MRVTLVQGAFLPVPPLLGGAVEKVWTALGRWLAARGHTVTHMGRSYPGLADEETVDGVRYLRVPGFETPRLLWRLKWLDLVYTWRILPRLPAGDVVVSNTFWLPVLLRNPQAGAIYVHVARYPRGQMRLYGGAARWQTVSTPIADTLARQAPWGRERIRVIPYFIPPAPEVARERIPGAGADGVLRLVYAGRVHPEKGVHLILGALARLSPVEQARWQVRVVGPWRVAQGGGGEEYRDRLMTAAALLRLPVAFEEPRFDPAQLQEVYRDADVFVYPSLAEQGETFGLAPLEAMAAGCPVLVSDLACFRDFLQPGAHGWVFDHRGANAEAALAARLREIAADPGRLAGLGEAARRRANDFTLDAIGPRYEEDLLAVAAAHHSPDS